MDDILTGNKVSDKTRIYYDRLRQIGERIKMLRTQKGWTQTRLGNELGELFYGDKVKQSMISSWEKGDTLPTLKNLLALSQLFDCDIGYLLCDYDDLRKDTSNLREVTGLSSETIEQLSTLVQIDKERLDGCGDDTDAGSYYEAVKHHLFMPTFNLLVGHPEFSPFMAMLVECLIDRDAPPNAGGPVDPREYAMGRRTIGAQEHSEFSFYRATTTLSHIVRDISKGYDHEIKRWREFFSRQQDTSWDMDSGNKQEEITE